MTDPDPNYVSEWRPDERSQLECPRCSARVPVGERERAAGWYRCPWCATPAALPLTPFDVIEGPEARVVLLRRTGRYQLLVPSGTILRPISFALGMFLVNLPIAMGLGAVEVSAEGFGRVFGSLFFVWLALFAVRTMLRLFATAQELEVSPTRLRLRRKVFGSVVRETELGFPPGAVAVSGTWRAGVDVYRIELAGAGEQPMYLYCASEREGIWTRATIERALDPDATEDAFDCPGCGAPLTQTLIEEARGHASCPYCQAGCVIGGEEVALAPLDLPRVELSHAQPGVEGEREGARVRWTIPRPPLALRLPVVSALLCVSLFLCGVPGVLVWVFPEAPAGAIGLRGFMIAGMIMSCGLAATFALFAADVLVGRDRITLDATTLAIEHRFPFAAASRFLTACARALHGTSGARPPSDEASELPGSLVGGSRRGPLDLLPRGGRVPVFLLTELRFEPHGLGTRLVARTPTRRIDVRWRLDPRADARLRAELVAHLRLRLDALDRAIPLQGPGPRADVANEAALSRS